ncbi:hypothetical protein KDAU_57710 [Dictyobacter aurantiacus]|uniref:Uncharacterized protein n=1 Tax=Dictyobacter aurantiacus TaxID=1936993 RepID=A0A401ZNL3_9CHLR|nr:hypothetical protein KDAU_57710 [Dictyobacter aurantiacus]
MLPNNCNSTSIALLALLGNKKDKLTGSTNRLEGEIAYDRPEKAALLFSI